MFSDSDLKVECNLSLTRVCSVTCVMRSKVTGSCWLLPGDRTTHKTLQKHRIMCTLTYVFMDKGLVLYSVRLDE